METLFIEFGLNTKEINTFLKSLELGAQPVSVLAKNLSIPRPTMYLIIESLLKKEMIYEFKKFGTKYVKAKSPQDLFLILDKKSEKIKSTREILKAKPPQLEKLENKLSITPKIQFFEGAKAVENLYHNIMREKNIAEFCSFFSPLSVKSTMPKFYDKIPLNIKKHNIKAREILVNCEEATLYQQKFQSQNHQIKLFPPHIQIPADNIICGDKLFLMSFGTDGNNISATEIHNSDIAKTQQIIFNQLWEIF